jgi:hypothetical protein
MEVFVVIPESYSRHSLNVIIFCMEKKIDKASWLPDQVANFSKNQIEDILCFLLRFAVGGDRVRASFDHPSNGDVLLCAYLDGPDITPADATQALTRTCQDKDVPAAIYCIAAEADIGAVNGDKYTLFDHTPLHAASELGRVEVVRVLLTAGADIEAANEWGTTPLQTASLHDRVEIVRALQQHQRWLQIKKVVMCTAATTGVIVTIWGVLKIKGCLR